MRSCRSEPTIVEMLADPMIRAVMAADRVEPQTLEAALRETARSLAIRGRRSQIRDRTSDGIGACI